MMDRRTERELTYKLIFEMLVTGKSELYTLEIIAMDNGGEVPEYITRVFDGIVRKLDELTALIASHTDNYKGKLFAPDKAALLLATYEIYYEDDIPKPVSINEAVELVKTYSTAKSASFVNGVLSKIGYD